MKEIKTKKVKIYDCFTFFHELDLLEIRLNVLDEYVDYFVLVEANRTFSGKEKELFFLKNKNRFNRFLKKIIHVIVEDMPEIKNNNRWELEHFQRNAIARGLRNCNASDIIIISDLDEIFNPETIDRVKKCLFGSCSHGKFRYSLFKPSVLIKGLLDTLRRRNNKIVAFNQSMYYYYLNGFVKNDWRYSRAIIYSDLVHFFQNSPQKVRDCSSLKSIIDKGGWHFSYLLDPAGIKNKIESFSHSEYDYEKYKDIEKITQKIKEGRDIFDRDIFDTNSRVEWVDIDNSYPEYITNNLGLYKKYIYTQ